jgi:acetyl esterase/lipase
MGAAEFDGFGELVFPSRDRITDDMTIADTSRLLPYHSNIDPAAVAATVNGMLAEARAGDLTFHPVYSEAEIADDPAKAEVGLFFFRGEAGSPFSIVSPGGGFSYVGSVHEGFPYAQQITAQGNHAFVLNYRTGDGGRLAAEDLATAIDYVFANAETLGVDTDGYSLWGSSAGARMAANLGSARTAAFGRTDRPRPDAVIMAYTGHSATGNDPATFAVVGENDGIASPRVMQDRIDRLDRAGVPTEFHIYPGIGHGFGLGTGTVAEGWVDDALAFWETHRS